MRNEDGKIVIGTELNTKGFYDELHKLYERLNKARKDLDEITSVHNKRDKGDKSLTSFRKIEEYKSAVKQVNDEISNLYMGEITRMKSKGGYSLSDLKRLEEEISSHIPQSVYSNGIKITGQDIGITKEQQQALNEIYAMMQPLEEAEKKRLEAERETTKELEKQSEAQSKIDVSLADKTDYSISRENIVRDYSAQILALEDALTQLNRSYQTQKEQKPYEGQAEDLRQLEQEIEKTKNQLDGLYEKQSKLNKTGFNFNDLERGLKRFNKSLIRMALSLFSIRGAYSLISKAAHSYIASDEQLSKRISNLWFGLGTFLAPVIEKIVSMAEKLVGYINEFVKALTGRDFIAEGNARVNNLKEQEKYQNRLNKSTAKFDELNILKGKPYFDTTELDLNEKVVTKLQDLAKWLRENKELLGDLAIAFGIVFGGLAVKNLLGNISKVIGVAGKGASAGVGLAGLAGLVTFLATIGTIVITIKLIREIGELRDDIKGINEHAVGAYTNWLEEDTDKSLKNILNTRDANRGGGLGILSQNKNPLTRLIEGSENQLATLKNSVTNLKNSFEYSQKIAKETELTGEEQKMYLDDLAKTYVYLVQVKKRLEENGENTDEVVEATKLYFNEMLRVADSIGINSSELDNMIDKIEEANSEAYNLYDRIEHINIAEIRNKEFDLQANLIVDTTKAQTTLADFINKYMPKQFVNNSPGQTLVSYMLNGVSVPNLIKLWKNRKGLATGGIVNVPGRGVSFNDIKVGEAGKEGVIPLTDNRAMEELGATIGKYITINANITNEIDGRILNKRLEQINNNNSFSRNGG